MIAGSRVQGSGCREQGAGSRVQGAGCRVQGAGRDVEAGRCREQPSLEHRAGVNNLARSY